jgi:hypothetical protein
VSDQASESSYVPQRERAEVARAKVTSYLLDLTHPDGAPKAVFFTARGFSPSNPEQFIEALLAQIQDHPFTEIVSTPFGPVYAIDAPLHCPDGRSPVVRSVWIIEPPAQHPRFVTAYPAP